MSLGLLLLVAEALVVYALVFAIHALRRRYTLVPYYATLGALAASLRWTADAGIQYGLGPFTFQLGSVVFFTSILFGVFLLYVFDGVKATQLGIYVVVFMSVLVPFLAYLFRYQQMALGTDIASLITVGPPHSYVVSTAAMLFDFLCVAMLWEWLNRYGRVVPVLFRVFLCLWVGYSLDTALYTAGVFWEDPDYQRIVTGGLFSRLLLSMLVAPLVTLYILWERRRQGHQITPRPLMAILHKSARTEMDLSVARQEIETRIQVEGELRRRDAILESVTYTAEHLLAQEEGMVNVGVVLSALGNATDASRVYLCENHRDPNGEILSTERHRWSSPGLGEIQRAQTWRSIEYKAAGLARWEETLRNGGAIFGNVRALPAEERPLLMSRAVVSLLVLPIFVQRRWWGFLGLDACAGPRRWPRSEVDALRTAAMTLGAAVQRARIEAEYRASEERLELALDGGGLGLWDWDFSSGEVVFNERWATMLGYTLSEVGNRPLVWKQLLHPDDFAIAQTALRRFLRGDDLIFEMEYRMRGKSGDWYWILNRGKIVARSKEYRARRATGTHLDITRLKQTEEALRFSQEMFRLMFEEAPLGLVLCQLDGTFVQANPAYLSTTGYTEEELLSLSYWDVTPKEYAAKESAQIVAMKETGRYGPYEREIVQKGGGRISVLLNGCLVVGADGQEYTWSIVEDITARKATERALAEARSYERALQTRIGETLLRSRPPVDIDGATLSAVSAATQHMAGDFVEFVRLSPRCFDVLVGDVMGKGILAALVGAGTKSHFLKALTTQLARSAPSQWPSLSALVAAVHQGIVRQLIELERFLTLCYARFDLDSGRVSYVDCGHTKTIRYRPSEDHILFLTGDNVPLGFLEEEGYEEKQVDLKPGDLFFFYSDGITETRDPGGAMFGVSRLTQCLQTYGNLDAHEITERVMGAVERFSLSARPEDDQTCVVVKIASPSTECGEDLCFSVESNTSSLTAARDLVQGYVLKHAHLFAEDEIVSSVVLGFVEALSNVIRHAQGAAKPIAVTCRSTKNRFHVDIRHIGTPFWPHLTKLPMEKDIRESGYGLYIMNRSFDHIGYDSVRDGFQSITLVKYFGQVEPNGGGSSSVDGAPA